MNINFFSTNKKRTVFPSDSFDEKNPMYELGVMNKTEKKQHRIEDDFPEEKYSEDDFEDENPLNKSRLDCGQGVFYQENTMLNMDLPIVTIKEESSSEEEEKEEKVFTISELEEIFVYGRHNVKHSDTESPDIELGVSSVSGDYEDSKKSGNSTDSTRSTSTTESRKSLWNKMIEDGKIDLIINENSGMLDQDLVFPSPPTNKEKVMYHKSGKVLIVSMGVFSFTALVLGMWLFALTSPYFYFFCVVALFIMIYLFVSYLVVTAWAKEFDLEKHNDIILTAAANNYLPSVDIYLPVCNEPVALLDNTWKYIKELEYPNFTVHVLDDGAKEEVKYLAELYGFNYVCREDRPHLKKAGNIRYTFARTSGDIFVIFDADFCPRPEFLTETIPYFMDEKIGILQTPQFFRRDKNQSWQEKGANVSQEFFYRLVQVARDRFNSAICVGTCGVYRRSAHEAFGGTAEIEHSEDVYTGFRVAQQGYKVKYVPQILALGVCPDNSKAYFSQQKRWASGCLQLTSSREFWKSNIGFMGKLCHFTGFMYYLATSLSMFTGPLPSLILIFFRPDLVFWFNVIFTVPGVFFSVIVMRCWAKQKYSFACYRVKVLQNYAHFFALKEVVTNSAASWVPSGSSSKKKKTAYDDAVKMMIGLTVFYSSMIIGGSCWRISEYPFYHFIPSVLIALSEMVLNVCTLM